MKNYLNETIKIEFYKILKNKVNFIYIFIIVAFGVASLFGMQLFEKTNNANSGYTFLLFYLQTLSNTILPIMLLLFASSTISSEVTFGTIRNILVSGCSKTQFLISKIFASLIFQLILMFVAAILAIIFSYLFFGLGNITEDSFMIISKSQFWVNFFIAYILLIISLFAATSFGIFISTLIRNTVSSVTVAIGTYILIEGIKTKLHIENFVYSTYIEWPLNTISELSEGFYASWVPKIFSYLLVSFSWIILSLILSALIIKKRDYK